MYNRDKNQHQTFYVRQLQGGKIRYMERLCIVSSTDIESMYVYAPRILSIQDGHNICMWDESRIFRMSEVYIEYIDG